MSDIGGHVETYANSLHCKHLKNIFQNKWIVNFGIEMLCINFWTCAIGGNDGIYNFCSYLIFAIRPNDYGNVMCVIGHGLALLSLRAMFAKYGHRWVTRRLLFFSWMEVWHRKKRQFLCNHHDDSSPASSNRFRDVEYYSTGKSTCFVGDEDLELAACADKKKPLAAAFKTDIECGWGGAASGMCHGHFLTIVIAILVACRTMA